jgi:hypothetical protein
MVRLYEYKRRTNAKKQLSIYLRSPFTDSELHLNIGKLSSAVKGFGYAYMSEIITLQNKDHSNFIAKTQMYYYLK